MPEAKYNLDVLLASSVWRATTVVIVVETLGVN